MRLAPVLAAAAAFGLLAAPAAAQYRHHRAWSDDRPHHGWSRYHHGWHRHHFYHPEWGYHRQCIRLWRHGRRVRHCW
jgi:hypothetical protein